MRQRGLRLLFPLAAVAAGWAVARVDAVRRAVLPRPAAGEVQRGPAIPSVVVRAYDIRDLLPPAGARARMADVLDSGLVQWKGPAPTAREERVHEIEGVIELLAGRADRRHGVQPEFHESAGRLIVVETPDVQERIGPLLGSLRTGGAQGSPDSRGDAR